MNTEILARVQFAFTVAYHYIYPPLSIGLGLLLVTYLGAFLRTKDHDYHVLAKFWTKIFALTFGIGVVTGIVMEFEFGTTWATYSRYVGDIFGSALAAEGIFAFALESGFLGVLLFGWNKVTPIVHFISALGVFLGSMFSAVWIVIANSWQQTPAGFHIVGEGLNARAEITDFWAMVFNPSSMERLAHVWIGAILAGTFLVISVHSYYLINNKYSRLSKKAIKPAILIAAIASLLQLFTGHISAEGVAKNQPSKLAALEGHYETGPADMYLFGWVDQETKKVFGLKVPGGLSLLLHHNPNTEVIGLDKFKEDDRPKQINAIFQFYHLMVGIGMALIGLSIFGVFELYRGKFFENKLLLKLFVPAVVLPQLANQFGWFAAEMGRQPWVVFNLLKTSDAFSKNVSANQILFSLILFFLVYTVLFILFIYLLNKKIKNGPGGDDFGDNDVSYTVTKEIADILMD